MGYPTQQSHPLWVTTQQPQAHGLPYITVSPSWVTPPHHYTSLTLAALENPLRPHGPALPHIAMIVAITRIGDHERSPPSTIRADMWRRAARPPPGRTSPREKISEGAPAATRATDHSVGLREPAQTRNIWAGPKYLPGTVVPPNEHSRERTGMARDPRFLALGCGCVVGPLSPVNELPVDTFGALS